MRGLNIGWRAAERTTLEKSTTCTEIATDR
jgi:hypothetical protein